MCWKIQRIKSAKQDIMAELFKNVERKVDVLDTLREWIQKFGPAYGSIKPEIKIYNKRPMRIILERGDEITTLEKDTIL